MIKLNKEVIQGIERGIIDFKLVDANSLDIPVRSHGRSGDTSAQMGQARLVTNVPGVISLGEATTKRGGSWRDDEYWETSYRRLQFQKELGEGEFIAYAANHWNSACDGHANGERISVLAGELPTLSYGTAYAQWAEAMEKEAYSFLASRASGCAKKVRHTLAFAAGAAHLCAPYDQRRKAWVAALRGLGVHEDVSRITGSVRTATVKAALRLGWQPSTPKPTYWMGYPEGVVEIAL